MGISNDLTPAVEGIDYATPSPPAGAQYGSLAAVLLCAPGVVCWALLAGTIKGSVTLEVLDRFAGPILLLVAAAVLTAVSSVIFYFFFYRRPKPWYVILNLVINISGLLFVAGVFILGALASR